MFQTFDATTTPEQGPPRLNRLREECARHDVAGFVIPRADAHQGEYVAARDERLAWLTGFSGSAGFAVVLADEAAVFVDGRYTVQVKAQVDTSAFTPVAFPQNRLAPWLAERLPEGNVIGLDPWLHTRREVDALEKAGVATRTVPNLIDAIWDDQPAPPLGAARAHPPEFTGKSSAEKRGEIAQTLIAAGQSAAVLTLPDSISWLLNIRGEDLPRIPCVQAFAILHSSGKLTLFAAPEKFNGLDAHLGPDVTLRPPEAFEPALKTLTGPVRVDQGTAPHAVALALEAEGIEIAWGDDPCILPKATKTDAELQGTREAHLRDGAAMVEFLAWLDREAPNGTLTEIAVVQQLEAFRRKTNALNDISFDTICGAGPHGAIVHYRVTEGTNRAIAPGELLLIDSGGQYLDGTTDITRTVIVGAPTEEHRVCFTRVLQGMIAISRARWPRGLSGRDLDPLARAPLWMAGQDYDHGTGHGVGAYLSVHEGPQRIARISEVPLVPGMILSNEPGYYREGAFGIRIENLVVVEPAPALPGGDDRDQLAFETLTYVPIDIRLVDAARLSPGEREWLNAYHAETLEKIGPRVSAEAQSWLAAATRAI
ncbi:MAG: aminopeptidase P family protein [Pseudomonadota bacterium]